MQFCMEEGHRALDNFGSFCSSDPTSGELGIREISLWLEQRFGFIKIFPPPNPIHLSREGWHGTRESFHSVIDLLSYNNQLTRDMFWKSQAYYDYFINLKESGILQVISLQKVGKRQRECKNKGTLFQTSKHWSLPVVPFRPIHTLWTFVPSPRPSMYFTRAKNSLK